MNKTVSITSLPSATGFGPGNSLVGVSNGEASLFPYDLIATGGTGSGATGETGATGATGATGPGPEFLDRLINGNLEVILDASGTLNTPLLLPTAFTSVCDETHMIDPVPFEGDAWWQFEIQFQVNPNGTVETMINNIFPILTNPGYESGYTFRFTEADHGIPDYIFDLTLLDVNSPGGAGWTANVSVVYPPNYPSTIKSLGAIKLTSDSNSIILGTDGVLSIPNTIEFPFSPGNSRTGSGNNLQFEKGSVYQKIISTQNGTDSAPTVERLVISGGDSYNDGVNDIGEGGDIYLWAGKGANGGDIKVDAGNSSSQEGGTIKIRGGYSQSSIGGFVQISSGYGGLGGGDISITADGGGTGIEAGGEIFVNTVGGNWIFKNDGSLQFPDDTIQTTAYIGGGSVSLVPNMTTYSSGSLYGNSNPGFTVEITGDDDSAYSIPIDFSVGFLENTYGDGNIWLVSNSYITFGPDEYTDYHPVGPGIVPVPAIYIGAADMSNQKYYYGYADGTDIYVIGYEGSIDTGGQENYPAIKWEMQVSSATPNDIKLVVEYDGNLPQNFPGGIWGISNGEKWVDQFYPLPWFSNYADNTFNSVTISPVSPQEASTIAFVGPGVTIGEEGGVTYVNIDPFDDAINIGYDSDNDCAVIGSTYYGLKLTTSRNDDPILIKPNGELYLKGGDRSSNQPGEGYTVQIEGGQGAPDPNNPVDPADGGSVSILGGRSVNSGDSGEVYIVTNRNNGDKNWSFKNDGSVQFPDGSIQTTAFTGGATGATGATGSGSSSVWNASESPEIAGNFWVTEPQPSPDTASVIFNVIDSNGNSQNGMFTTISGLLNVSIPIVFTITDGAAILSLLLSGCSTFDNQWEITGTIIQSDVLPGPANYVASYNITGPIASPLNFVQGSQIESIPNSAGDGLTASTMVLKPDSTLGTDQYIVLSPTEPNHIHIRAGGAIDDSTSDLFIGGEDTNLKVSDVTKTVEINSKNLYVQDAEGFGVGVDYASATWSNNLITITSPSGNLADFINGYVMATDVFGVFYTGDNVALSISNKDYSNFPTIVLTVDQTPPTPDLDITGISIQINRYQSGRLISDNGSVIVQAGDTDSPKSWTFGMDGGNGKLTFPDSSIQTTAYPGIPASISSGNSAPGSAVVANPTNVNINFSDGIGTAWSFGTTGLTFPDETVQTTAWTGGRVVEVPQSSIGSAGDLIGDLAFNSSYLYYCTENYGGIQYQVVSGLAVAANGVDSGYLVFDNYQLPQVGWQVNYDGNSAIIDQVNSANPGYYIVFVSTPLVIPGSATFSWGPIPSTNIWKRIGWSNDTW